MQLQRFEELKREFESAAKRWYAAEKLDQRLALLCEVQELTQEVTKLVLLSEQEWRKRQREFDKLIRTWRTSLWTGRPLHFIAKTMKQKA